MATIQEQPGVRFESRDLTATHPDDYPTQEYDVIAITSDGKVRHSEPTFDTLEQAKTACHEFAHGSSDLDLWTDVPPRMNQYVTGEWPHLFGAGGKETRCRIAIDLVQSKLVAAQEWTGLKFEDVLGDRLKDIAESVIEVNNAHVDPDDWGLEPTEELPAWAGQQKVSNHAEALGKLGYYVRSALRDTKAFRWWKKTDGDGVSVLPLDCSNETFPTIDDAWLDAARIEGLVSVAQVENKPTNPATKLVQVQLSAMTRVEYTEVVEVPADITQEELNELVNERYRHVDGGDFISDPEYWERGTCEAVDAEESNEAPTMVAFRTENGLHIERAAG